MHTAMERPRWAPTILRFLPPALLLVHAGLLMYGAAVHSPSIDEVGHMAAGLSHWKFQRFDLYHVNPPLVRMVAVTPVLFAEPKYDWSAYSDAPGARSEFQVGRDFISANGERSFWFFTWARWACIPFSLLGGYVCYRWARELYGDWSGLLALTLWCFEPNILAHAQMITPDAGATAFGVTAAYFFWKWLKEPSWELAFGTGLALGVAELSKTSWILFFALWPLLWVIWKLPEVRSLSPRAWLNQAGQLALILCAAVFLINATYVFDGSMTPLGDYSFVSDALGGSREQRWTQPGNRFANSWVGVLPVPVPRDYLLGIDVQKHDFEVHTDSYLRGEWRNEGWWYYYIYALAIKVPLGVWLLALLAVFLGLTGHRYLAKLGAMLSRPHFSTVLPSNPPPRKHETLARTHAFAGLGPDVVSEPSRESMAPSTEEGAGVDTIGRTQGGYAASWRDELTVLAPAILVLTFVSSQTGFNHHSRYVLPIFPFAFIWMSKAARVFALKQRVAMLLAGGAVAWAVASSLWVYPHCLSYFSEIVGGPANGSEHLVDSNIDWGQDLMYLRDWLKEHPKARPFGLAYFGGFDPRVAGIEFELPPTFETNPGESIGTHAQEIGPRPGWYAVSVSMLRGRAYSISDGKGGEQGFPLNSFCWFQRFQPVAHTGWSIYIYRITPEECTKVRRELGLPELIGSPP